MCQELLGLTLQARVDTCSISTFQPLRTADFCSHNDRTGIPPNLSLIAHRTGSGSGHPGGETYCNRIAARAKVMVPRREGVRV